MPSFKFDESKTIDENLLAFYKHLESYNAEFARKLAANLDAAVVGDFDRNTFNTDVATMLDTLPAESPS